MNYVGKFDAMLSDGPGAHSHAQFHVDTVTATHAPSDAIIVPDAHLLFNGDFKRSGVDLILSGDDRELVLHDYFKGQKHAPLASPDGAHLTGDIVDALTGHVQYAQADGSASVSHVIGHVTKLAGTATVIRNGVSIILNVGDNVEKGDVVQSGSNSTLGVTFIDGTVFGLASNARMVLNEMVYDPNGSNNSSLISLVAGTISFVAGETAKHGDMKVDTPVATMGIRGTAVLVEIDFSVPGQGGAPDAKFQVLVEPDGTTGNYVLFDKVTLAPIATVNQAGQVLSFSNGNFSITSSPLTPDMQKLITDVFNQKFTDNTNTKSTDTQHSDIGVPQNLPFIKLVDGTTATAKVLIVGSSGDPLPQGPNGVNPPAHINQPPQAVAYGNKFTELAGKTGDITDLDTVSGTVNYTDINGADVPTVQTQKDTAGKDVVSFTYQDAHQNDITGSLNPQQLADIAAVEAKLVWVQDPGQKNNGTATWTYSVADKAFDFLAAGETLTLTYTAEVDNNFTPNPDHAIATFTITITGTNDVPVITTGPESVAYSGGKFTPGGNLHTVGNAPTTGTLSFADVDLTDTHTVSAALTNASMSGDGAATLDMAALDALAPAPMAAFAQALTAKILAGNDSTATGNGTVSWSLADLPVYLADFIPTGEVLTLTYTVTVGDSSATAAPGQPPMSVSTQTVTVTITGTATAAVVWVATTQSGSTGNWNDASNWETGTVPTESDDAIVITNQLQDMTPYYPVTIGAAAFAKTVTMNDFGSTAPEIDNNSSLTIRGEFDLFTDAIVKNTGTISVGRTATGASIPGGSMEVQNKSQLVNTGTLILGAGGDFQDQSSISNVGGTIEIAGGTLNVLVGIGNSSGFITVDSGATLVLNGGAITGGTVTDNGTIEIVTSSAINAATLDGGGVTVDANQNLTLDGTVVNGTVFDDTAAGASLSVGAGDTLTLENGAVVNGGTINNAGILHIETTTGAALNGVNVVNTGGGIIQVDVSGGVPPPLPVVLTLGDGTVVTDGTLSLGNSGKVEIATATTATLDGVTVDNGTGGVPAGIIQVDGTLQINGTSISGGMLGNTGTIDVSGTGNLLSHVQVTNTGTIEILSGALKISSGSISGGGSVKIDGGALFELDGSDTQNIVFAGAHSELQIDGTGSAGNALSLGGNLVGLAATDELDLRTIGYGLNTTGTYVSNANHTGGILTITDGTHSISMNLVGDYSNAHFAGATDGNGGTLVTLNANDDAPVFATADLAQAATLKEVAGQTGVAAADSSTPASGTFHFTDIDLTDRPTAAIAQSVTWMAADGVTNLSASLNQVQLDALEHALVLTQSGNTNNGAIGWSYSVADSALDFLALGETATVVSTITLDDGQGGTDATTVTIHITGTNDTPTIAATSAAFAEQSNASQPNPTGSTAPDTVLGTISFTDVDLTDTHTVTVTGVSASGGTAGLPDQATLMSWMKLGTPTDSTGGVTGSDAWTFSAPDQSFDYLAAGQQVILSYTAQVDDGHGGVITTPFTVTITGTNDTPTIAATSAAFAELPGTGNAAIDHAGGTVTFTDVDLTDTPAVTALFASYSYEAADGTTPLTLTQAQASAVEAALTLTPASGNANNGSVAWSYDVADYNFDFLAAGQKLTLTYDATVNDGHGGVATQPFTVTITGTNDVPVIVGETDPATQTFILAKSPVVLAPGITSNALGLHTETFDTIAPGSASNNGLNHGNFFDADLGATFSASGHAGVVTGSSSVTAAPFIGHTDTTPYLSIGANSSETITFAAEQNAFGLYWGSADSYNTISFYDGTELVASYTGADVSPLLANGGQGSFSSNGYAEFVDLAPFNKVVLATSSNAFEIDNVSAGFISDSHNQLAGPITGTLSVSDADVGDTLTASVIGDGVVKYDGSTTLPSGLNVAALIDSDAVTFDSATTNGGTDVLHWTYNPTNADLDFLEPGDTLSVTFKAQVSDGHVTTGDQSLTVNIVGAGGSVVNGTAQNDTFVNVGGNVTVFGNGGQDNFVFKPGFGSATIADFDVTKDTIDIDHTLFANVTQLLAGAVNSGHDTIITDAAHDTITLKNVSVAALTAHQSDFHFT